MPRLTYCVFGCRTKGITIHNFPNPAKFPERFRKWVDLVGPPLRSVSDKDIYPKMKVCDLHFTQKDRNRNKRLNALAIPSIRPHMSCIESNAHEQVNSDQDVAERIPTSPQPTDPLSIPAHQLYAEDPRTPDSPHMSPHWSPSAAGGSQGCIECCRKLTQIRRLRHEVLRLRKQCSDFEGRLGEERNSTAAALEKVTSNMAAQGGGGEDQPGGRKFLMPEKLLALSLYKQNPESYAMLSKSFTLPAAKTLKNMLRKISHRENEPAIRNKNGLR